jgi:L-asparaginase
MLRKSCVILQIISTGGTFEKVYDPIAGELAFNATHLKKLKELCKITIPCEFHVPFLVDSLNMTSQHREQLLELMQNTPSDRFVIIHGTDTMTTTASFLSEHLTGKTIVLTGAMVPFSIEKTEAAFNFGFALASAQSASPGIWIAMNGRLFPQGCVRKNKQLGLFEQGL